MHDRSLKLAGNLYQLRMSSFTASATEDGDLFRSIQKLGELIELFVGRTNGRLRIVEAHARPLDGIFQSHVAGQDNYGDAALRDCGLDRSFENARHLFGFGHELTVMAALGEDAFRVGLLEVSAAYLATRNLRC